MDDLLERYTELNKSFKKKFAFHFGVDAGFFSEYNNMILAMLYCLTNNIQFILYSKDAKICYEKGWTDYFQPFCDAILSDEGFHARYNLRNHESEPLQFSIKDKIKIQLYKTRNGITYLTQDLWQIFHNREMENKHYIIPQLGIDGDIREACKVLVELTWRYNAQTKLEIEEQTKAMDLPSNYLGFHIRRGDKSTEVGFENIDAYFDKAAKLSSIRDVFVSTDDYSVIEHIEEKHPQWNIYTLSSPNNRGYVHADFISQDSNTIKNENINLLSSIDILKRSDIFIGTFSSNIGMFLGMSMGEGKSYSMDIANWQIW